MALKFKFKSKDEIPADHLPLYAEREGAWVLDVEGGVDKTKLDEIRTTNVALLKERDELKQRFEGIDPEEVRQLKEAHQKAEEDRLLGRSPTSQNGEDEADKERKLQAERERIEKVIEGRVKSIKGDLEKQVNQLTTERDALNTRLAAIQIDQGVITVATKRGLRPTAMADITSRACMVFRLVNGVPTACPRRSTATAGDGKSVRYGRDGLTPMSIEEWVDGQVAEAPHLMEHHKEAGVFAVVSELVDQHSDNPAAQLTAQEIIERIQKAQG